MNCLPGLEHLCRKCARIFIGFERFVKKKSVPFRVGTTPDCLAPNPLGGYVNRREQIRILRRESLKDVELIRRLRRFSQIAELNEPHFPDF